MDVLREREVKDSLERQLVDEQKIRVLYQKRFRKERKARRRLQEQLELEMKRRAQLEEALKASGANPEALRLINDTIAVDQQSQPPPPPLARPTPTGSASLAQEQPPRSESPQAPPPPPAYGGPQTPREPPQQSAVAADSKAWNAYSGLDLMSSGAAFWQNYSESLAQELEMERKSRQQQVDRDVKSPLQDRANYYKNSVLFTSAT